MDNRIILTQCHRWDKKWNDNLSRQRSWRDYVSNPQSLHPVLKYDPAAEEVRDRFEQPRVWTREIDQSRPKTRRIVEFWRFRGEKEMVWVFEFISRGGMEDTFAKYIDENFWLIMTGTGNASIYVVNMTLRTVRRFVFCPFLSLD